MSHVEEEYVDYSCSTPLERLARDIETTVRKWHLDGADRHVSQLNPARSRMQRSFSIVGGGSGSGYGNTHSVGGAVVPIGLNLVVPIDQPQSASGGASQISRNHSHSNLYQSSIAASSCTNIFEMVDGSSVCSSTADTAASNTTNTTSVTSRSGIRSRQIHPHTSFRRSNTCATAIESASVRSGSRGGGGENTSSKRSSSSANLTKSSHLSKRTSVGGDDNNTTSPRLIRSAVLKFIPKTNEDSSSTLDSLTLKLSLWDGPPPSQPLKEGGIQIPLSIQCRRTAGSTSYGDEANAVSPSINRMNLNDLSDLFGIGQHLTLAPQNFLASNRVPQDFKMQLTSSARNAAVAAVSEMAFLYGPVLQTALNVALSNSLCAIPGFLLMEDSYDPHPHSAKSTKMSTKRSKKRYSKGQLTELLLSSFPTWLQVGNAPLIPPTDTSHSNSSLSSTTDLIAMGMQRLSLPAPFSKLSPTKKKHTSLELFRKCQRSSLSGCISPSVRDADSVSGCFLLETHAQVPYPQIPTLEGLMETFRKRLHLHQDSDKNDEDDIVVSSVRMSYEWNHASDLLKRRKKFKNNTRKTLLSLLDLEEDDPYTNADNEMEIMERKREEKLRKKQKRILQLQADYWRFAQLHHLKLLSCDYETFPLKGAYKYSMSFLCSTIDEKKALLNRIAGMRQAVTMLDIAGKRCRYDPNSYENVTPAEKEDAVLKKEMEREYLWGPSQDPLERLEISCVWSEDASLSAAESEVMKRCSSSNSVTNYDVSADVDANLKSYKNRRGKKKWSRPTISGKPGKQRSSHYHRIHDASFNPLCHQPTPPKMSFSFSITPTWTDYSQVSTPVHILSTQVRCTLAAFARTCTLDASYLCHHVAEHRVLSSKTRSEQAELEGRAKTLGVFANLGPITCALIDAMEWENDRNTDNDETTSESGSFMANDYNNVQENERERRRREECEHVLNELMRGKLSRFDTTTTEHPPHTTEEPNISSNTTGSTRTQAAAAAVPLFQLLPSSAPPGRFVSILCRILQSYKTPSDICYFYSALVTHLRDMYDTRERLPNLNGNNGNLEYCSRHSTSSNHAAARTHASSEVTAIQNLNPRQAKSGSGSGLLGTEPDPDMVHECILSQKLQIFNINIETVISEEEKVRHKQDMKVLKQQVEAQKQQLLLAATGEDDDDEDDWNYCGDDDDTSNSDSSTSTSTDDDHSNNGYDEFQTPLHKQTPAAEGTSRVRSSGRSFIPIDGSYQEVTNTAEKGGRTAAVSLMDHYDATSPTNKLTAIATPSPQIEPITPIEQRQGERCPVYGVSLKTHQQQMYSPYLKRPLPLTTDVVIQRYMLFFNSDSRKTKVDNLQDKIMIAQRFQRPRLLSDMSAFKAANPGSVFEDFIKWYGNPESPFDEYHATDTVSGGIEALCGKEVDDEEESVQNKTNTRDNDDNDSINSKTSSIGTANVSTTETKDFEDASEAMQILFATRRFWSETWSKATPTPALDQPPLFNVTTEMEKVLHYLETMHPSQLLNQVLSVNLSTSYFLLVATAGPAGDVRSVRLALDRLWEKTRQALLLLSKDLNRSTLTMERAAGAAAATFHTSSTTTEQEYDNPFCSRETLSTCDALCDAIGEMELLLSRATTLLHKFPGEYETVQKLLRKKNGDDAVVLGINNNNNTTSRLSVLKFVRRRQMFRRCEDVYCEDDEDGGGMGSDNNDGTDNGPIPPTALVREYILRHAQEKIIPSQLFCHVRNNIEEQEGRGGSNGSSNVGLNNSSQQGGGGNAALLLALTKCIKD